MIVLDFIVTPAVLAGGGYLAKRTIDHQCPAPTFRESFNLFWKHVEDRFKVQGGALLLALTLFLVSMIYVHPGWILGGFGNAYSAMASDPFGVHPNPLFPHRILTPLISYAIGLRGDNVMVTNLILALLFCFLIVWEFRRSTGEPYSALIAGIIFTFTLPTLNSLYNSGYCDSASLILTLVMWMVRRKLFWFYLCYFLSLLNRESALNLLPWFMLIRWTAVPGFSWKRLIEIAVGFGVVIGLYAYFYFWINTGQPTTYSLDYYLKPLSGNPLYWIRMGKFQTLGLYTVFKFFWIIPVLAMVAWWKRKEWSLVLSCAILLAAAWTQFIVAFDSSRLLTQAYFVMFLALQYALRENPRNLDRWIGWLMVICLFTPTYYTASDVIITLPPLSSLWQLGR
jgi:hypothetical protein